MKNLKRMGMLSLIVVALVFISGVVSQADGNGAEVYRDGGCYMIGDINGTGEYLYTEDSQGVVTPSGNTRLTCHFEFDKDIAPAKAVRYRGFSCGTYLGSTEDSQSITTPGGTALLVCMIKAND